LEGAAATDSASGISVRIERLKDPVDRPGVIT
jgi:hypothetical protein